VLQFIDHESKADIGFRVLQFMKQPTATITLLHCIQSCFSCCCWLNNIQHALQCIVCLCVCRYSMETL